MIFEGRNKRQTKSYLILPDLGISTLVLYIYIHICVNDFHHCIECILFSHLHIYIYLHKPIDK